LNATAVTEYLCPLSVRVWKYSSAAAKGKVSVKMESSVKIKRLIFLI